MQPDEQYISQDTINLIANKEGEWELHKLKILVAELNKNIQQRNSHASLMLIRAICDHIPPLLGKINFEEVVNSYKWGETDKKYMRMLLNQRTVLDDVLHRQVSSIKDLIEMTDVPTRQAVNRLLAECMVSKTTHTAFMKTRLTVPTFTKITANKAPVMNLKSKAAQWANWGGAAPGFRVMFEVDNFNKPDNYICDAKMMLNKKDGQIWESKYFFFVEENFQSKALHIPATSISDLTIIFSELGDLMSYGQTMPEVTSGKLVIVFAEGEPCEVQFTEDQLVRS